MASPLLTGHGRYDRAALATQAVHPIAGSAITYGGFADRAVARGLLPAGDIGRVDTPYALYATDHLKALPPPGAEGFVSYPDDQESFQGPVADWWEPPPGFLAAGALVRAPRLLLVLPSLIGIDGDDDVSRADASRRVAGLWASTLRPLGLRVCLSSRRHARLSPLAALLPATSIAADLVYSQLPAGEMFQPAATYPADDALVGGEILVIELNWTFCQVGGGDSRTNNGAKMSYYQNVRTPSSTPPGAKVYPWENHEEQATVVFSTAARRDAARAAALAARCAKYGHVCYQVLRAQGIGVGDGMFDYKDAFAHAYGTAPFASHVGLERGDEDYNWERIARDIQAFFAG